MGQGPGARVMVGRRGSLGVANSWWNSSELSSWSSSDAFVCSFRDVSKFGYGSVWLSRMDGHSPKILFLVLTHSRPNSFSLRVNLFRWGSHGSSVFHPSHQPLHAHRHLLVGGLEHGFYFSIYWEFMEISSSQLTNSMIFQRGWMKHQVAYHGSLRRQCHRLPLVESGLRQRHVRPTQKRYPGWLGSNFEYNPEIWYSTCDWHKLKANYIYDLLFTGQMVKLFVFNHA